MSDERDHRDDDPRRRRLAWQCRRGMAELDELLQTFLQRKVDTLAPTQLQTLERMLQLPDQLLFEYLMGRIVPADPAMARLAQAVREAQRPGAA